MNQTPTPVDLVILTPLKIEYQSIIPYLSNIKLEKVGGHLYELGNYKGEYFIPNYSPTKSAKKASYCKTVCCTVKRCWAA